MEGHDSPKVVEIKPGVRFKPAPKNPLSGKMEPLTKENYDWPPKNMADLDDGLEEISFANDSLEDN